MKTNTQDTGFFESNTFQPFSKTKRNTEAGASYTEGKPVYKKSLREMRNGNKRKEWEEV